MIEVRPSWDQLFISMKHLIAQRSSDPNTKVGCIIVTPDNVIVSMGYNGWPRNIGPIDTDDVRLQRPEKYNWIEHAERNALYNALRLGQPVQGCRMYTCFPCADCARGIIQAGIVEIVLHTQEEKNWKQASGKRWTNSYTASSQMLSEANVTVREWDGALLIPESYFGDQYFKYPLMENY